MGEAGSMDKQMGHMSKELRKLQETMPGTTNTVTRKDAPRLSSRLATDSEVRT